MPVFSHTLDTRKLSSHQLSLIAMYNSWNKKYSASQEVDRLTDSLEETRIEPTIDDIVKKMGKSKIRQIHPIEIRERRKRAREPEDEPNSKRSRDGFLETMDIE